MIDSLATWQTLIGALIGAVITVGIALWVSRYQRQGLAQTSKIAEQQHRHAVREGNRELLHQLAKLNHKLRQLVKRGEGEKIMLARNSDFAYELMMRDPELDRLNAIAKFETQRERARSELLAWKGSARAKEPVQELFATTSEIARHLEAGDSIEEIARGLVE